MLVLSGHKWPGHLWSSRMRAGSYQPGPALALLFFVACLPLLQAQSRDNPGASAGFAEPVSLVGMTLEELIQRFGVPLSVYPSRGLEEWQDDVVFSYPEADCYVYKNRVWQAGLKEIRGIKIGQNRNTVVPALESLAVETRGDSLYCPLQEGAWPMMLRIDFDKAGKVGAIYIYRTDF